MPTWPGCCAGTPTVPPPRVRDERHRAWRPAPRGAGGGRQELLRLMAPAPCAVPGVLQYPDSGTGNRSGAPLLRPVRSLPAGPAPAQWPEAALLLDHVQGPGGAAPGRGSAGGLAGPRSPGSGAPGPDRRGGGVTRRARPTKWVPAHEPEPRSSRDGDPLLRLRPPGAATKHLRSRVPAGRGPRAAGLSCW